MTESHRRIKSYSFTNYTNNYKNNNISYEDQFSTNTLMQYKDDSSKKVNIFYFLIIYIYIYI